MPGARARPGAPDSSETRRENSTSRPPNIPVGSQIVLHPALDDGARALHRHLVELRRARTARGGSTGTTDPDVRPPGRHGLVAVDQVLVDERRPELVGVDRAGDGLDGRHEAASYSLRRHLCRGAGRIAMAILIVCLLASMVIALVKLL